MKGVKKIIVQIVKYFRIHHQPSAWLKHAWEKLWFCHKMFDGTP